MSVTIYDIAEEVGTSTSTVSRVMNGSTLIGPDLTEKIIATADRLGYKKRAIRKQKSRAILNIKLVLGQLADTSLPLFYSVPKLIDGLKEGIPENQLNIICETSVETEILFASKKAGHVDAVIFAFTQIPKKTIQYLKEAKIPFLALNREIEDGDFIAYPNREEMKSVTTKVIEAKNAEAAIFLQMNESSEISSQRREGFVRACKTFDVPPHIHSLNKLNEISDDFIHRLHKKECRAIIAMNDIIATAFIMRANQLGYKIPEDFSVSGFDGSSITAVLPKQLCTVKLDIRTLGHESGKWITERVINRSEQATKLKVSGEFIPGETL